MREGALRPRTGSASHDQWYRGGDSRRGALRREVTVPCPHVETTTPFSRHRHVDLPERPCSRLYAGDETECVLFAEFGVHFCRHLGNLVGRPRKVRDSASIFTEPLERRGVLVFLV